MILPSQSGAEENAYRASLLAITELLEDSGIPSRMLEDVLKSSINEDDEDESLDDDDSLLPELDDDECELIVLRELLLLDDSDDSDEDDRLLDVLDFIGLLLDELEFKLEEDEELLEEVS